MSFFPIFTFFPLMDFLLLDLSMLIFLEVSSSVAVLFSLYSLWKKLYNFVFSKTNYMNMVLKMYVSNESHLHDFKTLYPVTFFTTIIRCSKTPQNQKFKKSISLPNTIIQLTLFLEIYFIW